MPQLRGLPTDPVDTRLSKTLAYLLRHGAEKHDLPMRQDGYVRVHDLVQDPMLANGILTLEKLHELVKDNAKQRFVMIWARDESPERARPKKKVVHGKRKAGKGQSAGPGDVTQNVNVDLTPNAHNQLPLVACDQSETSQPTSSTGSNAQPEWYIRAAQGHSLPALQAEALLEPIAMDIPEGMARVGEMVHGTRSENWDAILSTGLSRMTRHHIHLSPSPIHPSCRRNSSLLIYLSPSALQSHRPDPIPVYISSNGVVLTPGDAQGRVGKEMWKRVMRMRRERASRSTDGAQSGATTGRREQDPEEVEHDGESATGEGSAQPPNGTTSSVPSSNLGKREAGARKRGEHDAYPGTGWRQWQEIIWEDGAPVDPPRSMIDGQ